MAGLSVFQYTLDHARALIAGVRLVEEEAMLEAMLLLLTRAKLLTEPAGAASMIVADSWGNSAKSTATVRAAIGVSPNSSTS